EIALAERARSEIIAKRDESPVEEVSENEVAAEAAPEPKLSLYERFARAAGERDYETYWERHFEHNTAEGTYRGAIFEFGQAVRELAEDAPRWRAENLVREAYMRRRIAQTIASGCPPESIVAVVGAFHAPVLNGDHPEMTDDELASLPKRSSKLT